MHGVGFRIRSGKKRYLFVVDLRLLTLRLNFEKVVRSGASPVGKGTCPFSVIWGICKDFHMTGSGSKKDNIRRKSLAGLFAAFYFLEREGGVRPR